MTMDADGAGRILEAALLLAERRGWDAVRLHDVAQSLGVGLAEIHRCYRTKDDLAEAWFDRADLALIHAGEAADWPSLPVRERLSRAILEWLQALATHRRATADMLRYKMQPDHLHLQAKGLMRVSRTVQWIRETARLPAVGLRRELEEVVLTGIFLGAVARWLRDDSPQASRTRAWLDQQLALAERAALRLPG